MGIAEKAIRRSKSYKEEAYPVSFYNAEGGQGNLLPQYEV